jgi:hypothetical protein
MTRVPYTGDAKTRFMTEHPLGGGNVAAVCDGLGRKAGMAG